MPPLETVISALMADTFKAYRIVHKASGKTFIGITTHDVAARWKAHCYNSRYSYDRYALHHAIAKHGADAFTVEHIASATSVDALRDLERALIAQHESLSPRGFNLTAGGDGVLSPSRETLARRSAKLKGKRHTPATLKRYSEAAKAREARRIAAGILKPKLGPMKEETKAKISAAQKGRKRTAAEREAISRGRTGIKRAPFSDALRAKMSAASKARWADPAWRKRALASRVKARAIRADRGDDGQRAE